MSTDARSSKTDSATETGTTRRQLLALAAVGGAGAVAVAGGATATAADRRTDPNRSARTDVARITVLGTTDLHGNVYNWDYFKNAPYSDSAGNNIGIAKAATIIKTVRSVVGAGTCVTLDAGDTIQGTPLAYYFAKIDPITQGATHPMAAAMNKVGYDAAALGNHEYNYGLDTLRAFEKQLNFPLLSANSVDWHTRAPVFEPWVIKTVQITGRKPIRVGILGLVTPGVAIWDKANVEGKVRFPGIVEQARKFVPKLRQAGADVVIVSCHSGADTSSSYGNALPWPENASTLLAEQVQGIDAILVGHAHKEIPQRFVTNTKTGRQVLLSEPLYWGMRVTEMSIDLELRRGAWKVTGSSAMLYNANEVDEDPAVAKAVARSHAKVLTYVNSVVGTSTAAMSAATSRYEDTAAIDFINYVQADAVKAALAGTPQADLPVLSIAAPFNKAAAIPAGEVTVRDVAGLYIYDNTLIGITLTGAQVKDYLEQSATYFKQVSGTGPFTPDQLTNAVTPTAPGGTPDYNYDIMAGLDADLTYAIDVAKAPGSRITDLAYAGEPIDPAAQFVIAINNYRQSGGGNFPHVKTAPVVYNRQIEIRQLLIDWVTANGTIDPASFSSLDWKLVSDGADITITD
ncbi:bifunctional metallophosphatase/5'-nucleotidase [Terracoccus luteus]|uniref:2',3'-cyclic-nucleotide 2'-phosphodiesterase/3'-nucleotidase n=1 Tax=Terracoccus luteus TaxID=53356 RepID=A0A839PV78_9MICO|nr:5'-nucleotidase C-terminal domain-containing protein [Terracoccus luteus]MBB2986933.1 2',3'-cyclic-nucleotide 2'-phosphodiesterase/3'-nucleotidase [Terracoccus luteus]MCP2172584.1 2',3'-cyclic-nucleotide 2'-phosphodiesterase/3'-nucleotidase [Terracoccus luteus]